MKNYIAKNIKYLREVNNLNQTDFAEKIGKKRSVVSSYENGEAEPNITTLCEIAKNFGITIDDIINKDLSINNTMHITKNLNKSLNKSLNSLQQSTNLLNTDINFSSDKAIQLLENEGLTGRRVYISPEPAVAGYLSSYINEGQEWKSMYYTARGLFAGY